MVRDHAHSVGLRFTLRHLSILIVYCIALFTLIIPLIKSTGQTTVASILLGAFLLSPPALALLVAFIERPGALKNWALALMIVLFFPALVLNHDCAILFTYLETGKYPPLWPTMLINVVVLANTVPFIARIIPRTCPGCRRWTLVPLMRLFKRDRRTGNTRWCASCGGKYWKDREGKWRVERRRTWLDAPDETVPAKSPAMPPGRIEAPGTPGQPVAARVKNEQTLADAGAVRNSDVLS